MKKIWASIYGIFATLGVAGIVGFWVLCFVMVLGWWVNVYKLVTSVVTLEVVHFTGLFILRVLGIFVGPLGGIMGWIG